MSALTLAVQDSATMLGREIKHSIRLLRLLIVSAVLVPVVMLLLFDYILGGTIGHGLGDAARGARYIDFLVPGILIMAVALLVGFRPKASVADWFAVVGIVAAFSFALAWLSAAIGLVTKSVAGANGSTLPLSFLLPFLSSTFVPPESMPAGVRWFAANQPFTPVVDSLRGLLSGAPVGNTPYVALAWCAAMALVSFLWAQATFRRGTR